MTDDAEPCVVCRRNEPTSGCVCNGCRLRIATQLDKLLRQIVLLPSYLAPSAAPPGERVSTSRAGSPTPAREDVLSLLAHSSAASRRPLVRHWSTQRAVDVAAPAATTKKSGNITITEWHQELVRDPDTGDPVMVDDDDQIGVLPPREWLGQQVDAWRIAFGHHRRPPTRVPEPAVPVWTRQDDRGDEWETRFGEPTIAQAPARNVRYLLDWFDAAADRDDLDLNRFAGELRALLAELSRVLGQKPDQQWLGRCPSTITDRAGGQRITCGAGLWQDPHASVVTCPRCRSCWGPKVVALLHLAREIRKRWPLDRRRRYTLDDIDQVAPIDCPTGCGCRLGVTWRDVTGTDDGWRSWFVPAGVYCPDGCAVPAGVL